MTCKKSSFINYSVQSLREEHKGVLFCWWTIRGLSHSSKKTCGIPNPFTGSRPFQNTKNTLTACLFVGGRSGGFRIAQRKPAVFRTLLRVLVPSTQQKNTLTRVFLLVDDQGLEPYGEAVNPLKIKAFSPTSPNVHQNNIILSSRSCCLIRRVLLSFFCYDFIRLSLKP